MTSQTTLVYSSTLSLGGSLIEMTYNLLLLFMSFSEANCTEFRRRLQNRCRGPLPVRT